MTAPNKMARAAAGTLALAVCLTGGVIGAGAAQAAPNFKFDQRIAGDDRIKTAVEASKRAFPNAGDAGAVVLTNSEAVVDGLSAAYVAGLRNAPILFVDRNGIPNDTATEIQRHTTKNVVIVGGTTVVPERVVTELQGRGHTVTRLAGEDRYATAAAVATSGTTAPGKVYIASGVSSADALVVSPIAFNKKYPILLTLAGSVPAPTSSALSRLNVNTRLVVGGTAVIDGATYNALGGTRRLAGEDRQGTAIEVADYAIADEGFATDTLGLVGGQERNSVDSLSGSPVAGKFRSPLLFASAEPVGINPATTAYLQRRAPQLTGAGYVYGGINAVTQNAVDKATVAAGGTGTTNPNGTASTIAVTPTDAVTQQLAVGTPASISGTTVTSATETGSTTDQARDNRAYTATGLTNGRTYRITLVDSGSIIVQNGNVTFLSSADPASRSGYSVDIGPDNADIISINGGAPAFAATPAGQIPANRTITAVPNNGVITFEIDGTNPGSVTPVIYLDGAAGRTDAEGGTSARLETSATGPGVRAGATEPFGLGGSVTYSGPLAENGTITSQTVASVNKGGDTFSTDTPLRFTYDSNDTFTVNGASADIGQFESQLSSGDTVTGTFAQDSRSNSTFALTDANPVAPTGVTATRGSGTSAQDITVTGTYPGTLREVDDLVIQRAPVNSGVTGEFTTIVTVAASDTDTTASDVQFRHVDRGVAVGTFVYRVAAVNDGDQGPYSGPSNPATVSGNTGGPTLSDTRLGVNGGNALLLESGDSFVVTSNRPFAAPTPGAPGVAGDLFRLQDADGTVYDVINGFNATFTPNTAPVTVDGTNFAAGRVLTIALTDTPTTTSGATAEQATSVAGAAAGLGIPTTITNQSGNTDVDGNELQITGSTDLIIDQEGAGPDNARPVITTVFGSNATTIAVTYNEPVTVTQTAAGAAQFTYDGDGTAGGGIAATAVTGSGSNTLTLTFPALTFVSGTAADRLIYAPGAVAERVKDLATPPNEADASTDTTVSP